MYTHCVVLIKLSTWTLSAVKCLSYQPCYQHTFAAQVMMGPVITPSALLLVDICCLPTCKQPVKWAHKSVYLTFPKLLSCSFVSSVEDADDFGDVVLHSINISSVLEPSESVVSQLFACEKKAGISLVKAGRFCKWKVPVRCFDLRTSACVCMGVRVCVFMQGEEWWWKKLEQRKFHTRKS